MMKVITCVLALLLGLGMVYGDSDICDITPSSMSCQGYEPYIKCLVKESGLANPEKTNNEILNELKLEHDYALANFGITCDFDLKSMVQQIQGENPQGVKPSTEIPTDYNNATTTVGCLSVLVRDGNVSCSELTPYYKCSFRVSGLAEQSSGVLAQIIPQTQTITNNVLSKIGLQCDISIASMLQEIQNGGTGSIVG